MTDKIYCAMLSTGSCDLPERVESLRARVAELESALARLSTFETFTTEGWGFSHPEITARVDYARAALDRAGS